MRSFPHRSGEGSTSRKARLGTVQDEKEPFKERINIMRKAFVLSGVALALLLFARGNALAKFHDSNFDGRYVCSGSSDDDDEQSVMFLKPNGSGGFTDG